MTSWSGSWLTGGGGTRTAATDNEGMRVTRRALVLLVTAAAACGDGATAPGSGPITAADVAALSAAIAEIDVIAGDPAVVSLRGVTVPFQLVMRASVRASTAGASPMSSRVAAGGRTAGLIGDINLPARVLGHIVPASESTSETEA